MPNPDKPQIGIFDAPPGTNRRKDTVNEEVRRITPESLIVDNNLPEVAAYLENWQENLTENNLWVVLGCSEPRLTVPRKAIADIRSIGTAPVGELYNSVLSPEFNPKGVIVMVHYDGTTLESGKMPRGCGGLGEKDKQNGTASEIKKPKEFSAHYVDTNIVHPDPLVQGLFTGENVSRKSGRPTLVVAQDHRTGELTPVASFIPDDLDPQRIQIGSSIPFSYGLQGGYNPEEIYVDGIPELTNVPDRLSTYVKRHTRSAEIVNTNTPDLSERQRLINPSTVAITTEIRPIQARFPTLLGSEPNTVFTVTVARRPDGKMYEDGVHRAFDQIHYALGHAIENQGDPEKPFARLHNKGTLLLEGNNLTGLAETAKQAMKLPYVKEWLTNEGNQMILLHTDKGKVQQAIPVPSPLN